MLPAVPRARSRTRGARAWCAILLLGACDPASNADPLPGAIAGRLTDPVTGGPRAAIRVVLQCLAEESAASVLPASRVSGKPRVTATDALGRYRFDDVTPGLYRLGFDEARYAGRTVADIRVVAGQEQHVDSGPVSMPTERITVLGRNREDAAGLSRLAFGRGDLDSRPAALEDPFRALAGRPGIAQESDFKSEMRIRGAEASDTAVLVDGQPLPYAYHFGGSAGSAGTLSADMVDEVQVHTGGFSVEYGDALAGVIDVSSRARRPESITGTAGIGTLMGHAALTGPAGEGSWMFSGRMSDLDLYDERVAPDQAQGIQFHDLFAALRQPLAGQARLEAVLLSAGSRFEAERGEAGRAAMSSRNRGGRVKIEAPLDERTLLRLQVAAGVLAVGSFESGGMGFDQGQSRQDVAVSILRLLGSAHRLNGGVGLERTRGGMAGMVFDGSGLARSDLERDAARMGAFLEDTWRPVEALSLRYGLRVDRSSETGSDALSPRASIELRPAPGLALRCAAGRFVQFPRQEQSFLAAGESLRLQAADHYILGLEKSFGTGLRIAVEAYRKNLMGPIGEAVNRYVELPEMMTQYDSGSVRGGEITLESAPARAWSLGVNYGYMVAGQERRGIESPRNADQRHSASLMAGLRFGRGWEMGAAFRFASGRPYTPLLPSAVGFTPVTVLGTLNSARLPSVHRLDLRVSRWVPVSWGRLGLQVDLVNVYNRANVRSVDLYYDEAENAFFRTTAYQSPFLPVVAVSAEF